MKTKSLLTLPAIFAALFFSCAKNNDPTPSSSTLEKISVANAMAATSATASSGESTCFDTYFNTIQNPPSGYVPGTAEVDLNNCLPTEWDVTNGIPTVRPVPPAPPVVLTPAPPPGPDPIDVSLPPPDDNLAYLTFFHVSGYGVFMYPRTLEEATQLFDRYCQIVCAAVTENISFPNPTHIDKAAAGVVYAHNHPEVFLSEDDKDMFLRFLGLVFAKPTFVITRGRGRPDTGGILYLASKDCVNFRLRIPPPFGR